MPKTNKAKEALFNKPNIISFLRLPLLLIAVYLILMNFNPVIPTALILLIFIMDFIDGYVARLFHEETKFGKVLDEMIDRIVENVFFITFAFLQYIPLWVPIIMVIRAVAVDTIVLYYGKEETRSYKRFIRSDLSRGGYGLLKMLLFMGLAMYPIINVYSIHLLTITIIVVAFSVFRGIVKIIESIRS
jgi:CDP-diacylglycerol--glycerol-3-phosphate 3-phosphatidyltransferase